MFRTTSDTGEYTPTEISFAVKQLLMKYLPNDHLAKVARNKNNPQEKDLQEKVGLIKKRPEFSFASLQYMKKYNLLASGDSQKGNIFLKDCSNITLEMGDWSA